MSGAGYLRRCSRLGVLLVGLGAASASAQGFRPVEGAPVPVAGGIARIGMANLGRDLATGADRVTVVFPERATAPAGPGNAKDRVSATLRGWVARGRAAGNHGDLYDNRDRGHSPLDRRPMPQVAATVYEPDAVAAGIDYGLNLRLLFDTITFGNSSTALGSGRYWRSLPRLAMTEPGAIGWLAQQHAANHLYVYPSHRDHRPDLGDLYPANTPYMLISEASSHSDQPHLRAIALILAALPPDTKALARERGLIAPTVQMLLRRGMPGIETDDDYLSGRAHPVVFDGKRIDPERLLHLANGLDAAALPPAVILRIADPPLPATGVGLFGDGLDERLFDTPQAAARLFRGTAQERVWQADACGTQDPNGRPLRFRWHLLRGDPQKVRLVPDGPGGCRASLTVGWHDAVAATGEGTLPGNRIDIGVFADNGAALSAPAFFSVAFPPLERRRYGSRGEILEVDYTDSARQGSYADPALFPGRDWRDVYRYDDEGRLLGWERERPRGRSRFTADGALVLETDPLGRPLTAERVRYPLERHSNTTWLVREIPSGERVAYRYAGPQDRLGVPRSPD